jgi:hypothetical protein
VNGHFTSNANNSCLAAAQGVLGALAELREATLSFVMSVRLSFRMEQLGFHWTDFDKN